MLLPGRLRADDVGDNADVKLRSIVFGVRRDNAEAFEVSEYGRHPSPEELRRLFPFFETKWPLCSASRYGPNVFILDPKSARVDDL